MSLSHICPTCGVELVRTRASFDRAIGIRIVICPGCRSALVRRRDPILEGWRWFLRAFNVGLAAFVQVIAAFLSIVGVVGTGNELRYEFESRDANVLALWKFEPRLRAGVIANFQEWITSIDGWTSCLSWVFLCATAGTWITAGLGHLGRRRAWLMWLAALIAMNVLIFGAEWLRGWLQQELSLNFRGVYRGLLPKPEHFFSSLLVIVPSAIVATVGIPLGKLCVSAGKIRARQRFVKRLKRLRCRRQG